MPPFQFSYTFSPPSCILVSSRTMEGTRSDVLACWGTGRVRSAGSRRDIDLQCLLRSIATPITTEPSARLTLPSSLVRLSLSLSLSASLFRLRPILSLIFSPCSATLVSDYQYHVADILYRAFLFFLFLF